MSARMKGPGPAESSQVSEVSDVDDAWAKLDLLTAESEAQLDRWAYKDKKLFSELIEDAGTELQQELLFRAVATGHRPAEVHAFADVIRGLTDAEIFAACTLDLSRASEQSVEDRLWAEADPIYAYLLNGYRLSPRDENEDRSLGSENGPVPTTRLPALTDLSGGRSPRKVEFDAIEPAPVRRADPHDLGTAAPSPSGAQNRNGRFAEDLFNEALRPLGVMFMEQAIEPAPMGVPLERALQEAATALSRGIPVPVVLGSKQGEFRRYALILQMQVSGTSRAFQIHDPFAQETCWANEGDLRNGLELRFSDKAHHRLTAIALPRMASPTPLSVSSSGWRD